MNGRFFFAALCLSAAVCEGAPSTTQKTAYDAAKHDAEIKRYLEKFDSGRKIAPRCPSGKAIKIANVEIIAWIGDITTLDVDAIVNAANESLLGGGGVDMAIHSAAGSELLEECKTMNGCGVGEAKITKGYNLPAKTVIHTVGPRLSDGIPNEAAIKDLRKCYTSCLELCEKFSLTSVAFCCISCGAYRFPYELAASIAYGTVMDHIRNNPQTSLSLVVFCVPNKKHFSVYDSILRR
ncbi:MAG: macro domain-containing protein [Puniceicoccales bacterium]|nr:macro domain-containing protein [Puniceicoccales bacterium]